MSEPRPEAKFVRGCLELALPGVEVKQFDDGLQPGMYDFDLWEGGALAGACEVTAAADPESLELWKLVNPPGERWVEAGLDGGWMVTVTTRARARRLRGELPDILRQLESDPSALSSAETEAKLASLKVLRCRQSITSFRGSIYVMLKRDSDLTGGFVSRGGSELASWFDAWVRDPRQRHNLIKLQQSQATRRHLVVLLPGFTTAPFAAADLLTRDDAELPEHGLDLPAPLSDVWLVSTWDTGHALHWNAAGWIRSPKPGVRS